MRDGRRFTLPRLQRVQCRRRTGLPACRNGNPHDLPRQLQMRPHSQGGHKDLCLLQPPGRREKRPQGNFTSALLLEGSARKSVAQRGRSFGVQGGYPGLRTVAQDQVVGTRNRVPTCACADAGFYRRSGGCGPCRDARCHDKSRGRCKADQPAGAGRSCDRPFGCDYVLRRQFGIQEKCRRGVQAERGTLSFSEVGATLI